MVVVAVLMLVVAAVIVFVIAAVVVGRESHRLDAIAPRTVYVLDEAVGYVADALPEESQARLTPDEVRRLLAWHMALLREKGLQPPEVVDRRQDIERPVVVEDLDVVGTLLARADAEGLEVEDVDVANVVDAHQAYLDEIGAIGPTAQDPDVR